MYLHLHVSTENADWFYNMDHTIIAHIAHIVAEGMIIAMVVAMVGTTVAVIAGIIAIPIITIMEMLTDTDYEKTTNWLHRRSIPMRPFARLRRT